MEASSQAQISDLGGYMVKLGACFDEAIDLPVPLEMRRAFEELKKSSPVHCLAKVPPPIQALILEKLSLEWRIANFPEEGSVGNLNVLKRRHEAMTYLVRMLVHEVLEVYKVRIVGGSINFYIDAEWNLCIPKS